MFFNWEAETKAYLEECRHDLIKKMLKKRINEGVLAVLQHYKDYHMVKDEASVLKGIQSRSQLGSEDIISLLDTKFIWKQNVHIIFSGRCY